MNSVNAAPPNDVIDVSPPHTCADHIALPDSMLANFHSCDHIAEHQVDHVGGCAIAPPCWPASSFQIEAGDSHHHPPIDCSFGHTSASAESSPKSPANIVKPKYLFQVALACFTISLGGIFQGVPEYAFRCLCISCIASLLHMTLALVGNYVQMVDSITDKAKLGSGTALLCTFIPTLFSIIAVLLTLFFLQKGTSPKA